MRRLSAVAAAAVLLACAAWGDEQDRVKVGVQPDGRIVVPTNQVLKPAGKQVTFPGRPVDMVLTDDGQTLVLKNMNNLIFLDLKSGEVKQTLKSPVGLSAAGLLVHDKDILVTDAADHLRIAAVTGKGVYDWKDPIELKKPKSGVTYPTGMALSGRDLWVTANRSNTLQRIDVAKAKVLEEVAVGVAPFAIVPVGEERLYVSNWGGDMTKDGDPRAPSSGTSVRVDPRTGVANHGSVSVVAKEKGTWKQVKSIEVGLHPSNMLLSKDGRFLFVANAASDTVSVIDTKSDTIAETISCKPEGRLPFGSGTNALALSPDGQTLYAANGTNNCLAVVRLGKKCLAEAKDAPEASTLRGLIPTGWYPGAILVSKDGKTLYVANIKGHGSLSQPRPVEQGKQSKDHLGSVSIIPVPDEKELAEYTKTVNANNRLGYSLAGLEKARTDVKPVPVPARHGEPSVFKHVIYVIKENRTYDQVFGDMKEGNGDPNLVLFGEDVTPNHHKLAREFTLLDNFYCSGVLSADGHQWCNEAYVVDYLERCFGKFARSYPYEGSDPLAFAPTGFLWDNALQKKKSFFNYGEFCKSTYAKPAKWTDVYNDYKNGTNKVGIEVTPNVETLKPYTRKGYPGFVLTTPDVYRAKLFIEDLKKYEKDGNFPNLVYLYLPCDHTSGTKEDMPTPKASVADNDLALGQVVEAVSNSKFWAETCILVVEDDPQNGFDHVDAHRTVAFAISPYTKRKFVDSTCYNQTGMVKTIELILGLPPMNQLDLSATPMINCFADKPDLKPYKCVANKQALDQMNPPKDKLTGAAREWAEKSGKLDFSEADLADEDTLNRILWHAVRGYDTPYPRRFAGVKEDDDD